MSQKKDGPAPSGTDSMGRQVWDKSLYAEKAAERAAGGQTKPSIPEEARLPLQQRETDLHLEEEIGKQKLVSGDAPIEQQGGFFCRLCECLLKDSASYLDHLNGKKHNRALGMSMRVKKATKQDVTNRLEALKAKKAALKKQV